MPLIQVDRICPRLAVCSPKAFPEIALQSAAVAGAETDQMELRDRVAVWLRHLCCCNGSAEYLFGNTGTGAERNDDPTEC